MKILKTQALLFCASWPALVASECTRDGISSAIVSFFDTAIQETPDAFLISPDLKVSSNGWAQDSLADTAHSNIMSLYRDDFRLQALDTQTCQGAAYVVVNEREADSDQTVPALVSLRVMLEEDGGPVQEVELLNVLDGQHSMFALDQFEETTPELWSTPQTSSGSPLSREELIAVADTYLEGIEQGQSDIVEAAPLCPRIENGQPMTEHCNERLEIFNWPVDARRYIADTETGVVFSALIFRGAMMQPDDVGDILHEFFKIQDGLIREIRAIVMYAPRDIESPWPEDSERGYSVDSVAGSSEA